MLSLYLGVYGHSHVETCCQNSTVSMEEVFLTVLDPSSVQIVYRMRSIYISKSGVRVLTGHYCGPRGVEMGCVSGLAHSAGRRTILLRMPQQVTSGLMIGRRRQIYGHFLDVNDSSFCSIVKYYPNLLPMIVLSALCKKSRASGKQRLTMFVTHICCRVHPFDGVAMLSHLYTSQVGSTEHTFERIYASAASVPRPSTVALELNEPIRTLQQ